MPRRPRVKQRKIFVLDTNVLIHDPIGLPPSTGNVVDLAMVVRAEHNQAKVGIAEGARNVRQVSRSLDELVEKPKGDIGAGVPIPSVTPEIQTGRLHFHLDAVRSVLPDGLDPKRPDNALLGVTLDLGRAHPDRDVVLVTKDINLRIDRKS